jgi:hypothetical protein
VRSEAEIPRAEAALQLAELPYEQLQPTAMRPGSTATLSTMHLAKGLEFRAVIVMACDEDVIPNAERIKAITDDSDLHPRPRSPADHQRRYLLGVCGGSARVTQPAPDQLKIAQAARTIAQQMLKERGMGRGRFLSAPTEADERN